MRAAEQIGFDLKTPFERLPRKIQNLLLYGKNSEGAPASTVFSGILPLLDRWYNEANSESYREWYNQYMSAVPCPKCQGKRLKPESLAVKVMDLSIADLTALPVIKTQEALAGLEAHAAGRACGAAHCERDHASAWNFSTPWGLAI